MTIEKCDICKKTLKDAYLGVYRMSPYIKCTVCESCGAPILAFMKKHKFQQKENAFAREWRKATGKSLIQKSEKR